MQIALGKHYNPKTKQLSRLSGKKDIPDVGGWHPIKKGTEDWMSTFRHEYGHFMDKMPKGKGLSLCTNDFKKRGKIYWACEVSRYGSSSAQELYAEAYSLITSPHYKKGMPPKNLEDLLLPKTKGKLTSLPKKEVPLEKLRA